MVGGEQSYFREISLHHATLAQLPESSELSGLSAVILMMYSDGSFARRPFFRYFALNTEMCWCALGAAQVYINFVNTLRMHAFLWKSCVAWLAHPFPVVSVPMLAF